MQNSQSTTSANGEASRMLPLAVMLFYSLINGLLVGCEKQTMSKNSVVRLEDSGEYVCDNPSLEQLRRTLESMHSSPGSFFILDTGDEHFMQGALNPGGFYLDYQESSPLAIYVAKNRLSPEVTLRIVDAYARGDDSWKQMCEWERKSP